MSVSPESSVGGGGIQLRPDVSHHPHSRPSHHQSHLSLERQQQQSPLPPQQQEHQRPQQQGHQGRSAFADRVSCAVWMHAASQLAPRAVVLHEDGAEDGGGRSYTASTTPPAAVSHHADPQDALALQDDGVDDGGQARAWSNADAASPSPAARDSPPVSKTSVHTISGGAEAQGVSADLPAVAAGASAEAGFMGLIGAGATTTVFDAIGVEQEPQWWWPATGPAKPLSM